MNDDAHAFKAYDIRGIVGSVLTPEFAYALGRAYAQLLREQGEATLAVGRDGRLSGPMLSAALIQGLSDSGIAVIDIGAVTTPMLYYAAATLCTSGIQVTGSHNPKDYNGFKMVLAGAAIYGATIQTLRSLMHKPAGAAQRVKGAVSCHDITPAYFDDICARVQLQRTMHIALDCGNGIAGATAPELFRRLGCRVTPLFCDVDGHFPNHHPDPGKPENLQDLIAVLRSDPAELGLALDGDGDRVGIVTKEGQIIYPDRQLMLLAQEVLRQQPGATIVYDVKCSQQLAPFIRAAGGVPHMCKTGHSLVKAEMKSLRAPLGGEMSGHLFFAHNWYGFDDGCYAAARLLAILSRHAHSSAAWQRLPNSCSTPELNIALNEGESGPIIAALQTRCKDFRGAALCTIDGVRLDWPDGFGLIRASNTTPVLVLRFEGQTPEALARIQQVMLAQLQHIRPGLQLSTAKH